METMFSRLYNGESSAIVGGPKSGKSSLIFKILDENTRSFYLGDFSEQLTVNSIDLQTVSRDYTPEQFWKECFEVLERSPEDQGIPELLEEADDSGYRRRHVQRVFDRLAEHNRRMVLLLDDFEELLARPHFSDAIHFFGLLRVIATRGHLTLIPASRLSVNELNKRLPNSADTGSPYLNHVIDVNLLPFDETTASQLLRRAGRRLSRIDRLFICCVAGCEPYLLQTMAAAAFETRGKDRRIRATREFYKRVSHFFVEKWRNLNDYSQTAIVVLGLAEWAGKAARRNLNLREISRSDDLLHELGRLKELGMAFEAQGILKQQHEYCMTIGGKRLTLGAHVFLWWIWEFAVRRSRDSLIYEEWLGRKAYECLLTRAEWETLLDSVRKAPNWAFRNIETLVRDFLAEFTRKSTP